MTADDADRVRLDKWLWAARFFKTRSLATEAIAGGKVEVNGERAKPAKAIKPGDEVHVEKMPLLLTVRVQKRFTRNEKVLVHAPASQAGLQRVTYVATYLNGQEIKRDPISIDTIEPPTPQRSL